MNLELELTPVYYRNNLQSSVPFPGLPEKTSAYAHQLQTYCAVARTQNYEQASSWCKQCELINQCPVTQIQALEKHSTLCITNSAITGGGKTLAAYAYGVENCLDEHKILGVYPTNELLHDQKRAVSKIFTTIHNREPKEGIDGDLLVVDGDFLRQEKDGGERNIKLIEYILKRAKIVLTNPDILYLLCHHLYASSKETTGINITAFSILLRDFRTIIFDEFHLYNIKQQASVLWLLGLSAQLFSNVETAKPHSFIFSSATPLNQQEAFGERLTALEQFGIVNVNIQQTGDKEGRAVMEAIKLRLESANLRAWEGGDKAVELLPEIQQLLTKNPEHRCLYVMDSVATARRLKYELSNLFDHQEIGEADGLVQNPEKREALSKIHTIGTSGIEVGIDFINEYFKDILLFEARTSAQFLQRLGRIGRNGRQQANNQAIAIVPPEVINYIKEGFSELPQQFDRNHLSTLIKQAFHWFDPERFEGYLNQYAPIEAEYTSAIYLRGFECDKNPLTGKIEETQERKFTRVQLEQLIQTLHPGYNREKAGQELKKLVYQGIISGILSFRGSANVIEPNIYRVMGFNKGQSIRDLFAPLINLEIPYFDQEKSLIKNTFPFHSYGLNYLLRRSNCQFITKSTFEKYLENYTNHPQYKNYTKKLLQGEPMIYAIVFGDLSKARKWYYYSNSGKYQYFKCVKGSIISEKTDYPLLTKVKRIKGLSIELEKGEESLNLDLLNKELSQREAIAYINKGSAFNLVQEQHLPPLFEVNDFRWGVSEAKYHITFDLNAFFLDSLRESNNPYMC
jgi:CRISPR-associated helicase Cas3